MNANQIYVDLYVNENLYIHSFAFRFHGKRLLFLVRKSETSLKVQKLFFFYLLL
jgi:hypothetical protein